MKDLIKKYKLVIKFVLTFLLVYGVLTMAYKFYLDLSDGSIYYPDFMTNLVARQTEALLNTVGYNAEVVPHTTEPSMKVIINNNFVARVIEGCNAVSIIILFASFVIAFHSTFKRTFIYILAGSILIYSINLLRIVVLSIGLYHYPWRREFLHTVVFPLIIYGLVFFLWMIWVNRFTKSIKSE